MVSCSSPSMMEFVDLFESTPNDWGEFNFEDMNLGGIYLELEDQDICTDHQSMPNIPEAHSFKDASSEYSISCESTSLSGNDSLSTNGARRPSDEFAIQQTVKSTRGSPPLGSAIEVSEPYLTEKTRSVIHRRTKNRAAQRTFRQRREDERKELQCRLEAAESHCFHLSQSCKEQNFIIADLKNRITKLKEENFALRMGTHRMPWRTSIYRSRVSDDDILGHLKEECLT